MQAFEATGGGPMKRHQQAQSRVMAAPYLQIGDFSRYGNHTLELSQEVKSRVNLR